MMTAILTPRNRGPNGAFVAFLLGFAILFGTVFGVNQMQGCGLFQGSTSPKQTFAVAQDSFIAATQEVISLRQAGKINDQTYNQYVLPQINRGSAVLTAWKNSVVTGANGTTDYGALLRDVTSALIQYQMQANTTNVNVPLSNSGVLNPPTTAH